MKTKLCKGDTRNLPVLHFFIIVSIFLNIIPVAIGDINLTISSSNNKTISIIQSDNSIIEGTNITQGDTTQLPYLNHKVQVITDNTFTMDNFKSFTNSIRQNKTILLVFFGFLLLALAFALLWM